MRIFCSLPVPKSLAETWTMPLASMSKVTSTWGMPRGAGGMPTRSNRPRVRFCAGHLALALEDVDGRRRSGCPRPWRISGSCGRGWWCCASMSLREDAAEGLDAERERRDIEEEDVLHLAAEDAALDGGADRDDLVGIDALAPSLPKMSRTMDCTAGMRVEPPTRMTWSIWAAVRPASARALRQGLVAIEEVVDQLLEGRARLRVF